MTDGVYEVRFQAELPGLPGTVELKDGNINGSDAGYTYTGQYKIAGKKISGTIKATSGKGVVNVFGHIDDLALNFEGEILESGIQATASINQAPDQTMEIVLKPIGG